MDIGAVDAALAAARANEAQPSLIVARTHIGFGSPNKADTFQAHGEPLGKDETSSRSARTVGRRTRSSSFPTRRRRSSRRFARKARSMYAKWQRSMDAYRAQHGDVARDFDRVMARRAPSAVGCQASRDHAEGR